MLSREEWVSRRDESLMQRQSRSLTMRKEHVLQMQRRLALMADAS